MEGEVFYLGMVLEGFTKETKLARGHKDDLTNVPEREEFE
jgi:hypothetical protein